MYTRATARGFTLVEVLVVLVIMGIVAGLSATAFKSMYQKATRDSGASELYGALTSARAQTLSAQNDLVYGVHVSSTAIVRFEGGVFSEASASNQSYAFEGEIAATSSIITSSGGNIIFTKLTGTPSATGEIHIYDRSGAGTTTLVVHETGLIEYK